jgi:hypothetical protein
MVLVYMVTFTINIPQMLAYIPAPWILWVFTHRNLIVNIHRVVGSSNFMVASVVKIPGFSVTTRGWNVRIRHRKRLVAGSWWIFDPIRSGIISTYRTNDPL